MFHLKHLRSIFTNNKTFVSFIFKTAVTDLIFYNLCYIILTMAEIRFYEELNDFLQADRKKVQYRIKTSDGQTVKDLIESQNIPHTEVDLILVNGKSVDFSYQVKENDRISVYPVFESLNIKGITKLRENPLRSIKFILDVHLGKLARYLRFSGFDSLYSNSFEDREIAEISNKEGRIVLTRDRGLLKRSIVLKGYWIRSIRPLQQYREVIKRFNLDGNEKMFSRCPVCNGKLIEKKKEDIIKSLPEKTARYFNAFKICEECGKIYWKGDHYYSFLDLIRN